ncbi:hypothetical protein GEV33_001615 [Tenebrio molitor]|uniref:Cytochrome P450 monooxygenase n=1 Tax=Tenebrio molitor TaxID=7067 RepID=A0A8J6HSV6_TENMO|nr:hypothetical protein GEV33_001615 [Tenebrio molitor]
MSHILDHLDVLGIVVATVVVVVGFLKWKFSYWSRLGLPTINPTIPFGDGKKLIVGEHSIGEQFEEFYENFKARGLKHGGVHVGVKPFYIPIDPELVKHILLKDFQHFVNRGSYIDEVNDPLSGHILSMEDNRWKNMRAKLTPTFTSGKIKMMFETLANCSVGLKTLMDESATNRSSIDIKEILARFTTDIIGSVAFGLDCNSLKDPDALFRKYGKKIFAATPLERVKLVLQFGVPHRVLKMFKFKVTNPDVEKFFMKAVKDTVAHREKNNIYRKDFMHLLIQLKNKGAVSDDDKILNEQGKTAENGLTMNELAAQAFIFFLGGFETSATTMTFAMYEIATNPHVQDKLREEINTVFGKNNDQMSYDGMMKLTYMDKALNETLRKHPPIGVITRQCSKDYTIPNTQIILKKGIDVGIPVLGIHKDPEYYPNPETFDPERFSEENKSLRPAFTWLPFGDGPRICIGLRFGLLQSKVGLATILKNYKIKLSQKTKLPLTMDKQALVTTTDGGIWIEAEKIN